MALTNGIITLRALEPDDIELLYSVENNVQTWRVSNNHAPFSKFILAKYIESSDRDIWESKQIRFMVVTNENRQIGSVELFDFDPYHSRAGVGILIFDTSDMRKGHASQTLQLICDYALNELGIYQLYANIAESNEASLKLFANLKFEVTGCKTNWLKRIGGEWENEYLLQKVLD